MAERERLQDEEVGRFWETARQRLEESNKEMDTEEPLDFSGETFPPDPTGEYFHGLPFRTAVSFAGAVFNCFNPFDRCEFGDEVDWTDCRFAGEDGCFLFARCQFLGAADFRDSHFPDLTEFRGVTFEDEADFSGQQITDLRFEPDDHADGDAPCRFQGAAHFDGCVLAEVSFSGVRFERDASFVGTRFTFWPRFRETTFRGKADFTKAVFERLSDEKRHAMSDAEAQRNRADFTKAVFEYDGDFTEAEFQCDVDFTDCSFDHDLEFRRATVRGGFIFERTQSRDGAKLCLLEAKIEGHPSSAYRTAKNLAHRRGDFRREGDFHYLEQCSMNTNERRHARWRCCPWGRGSQMRAWGSYIFGRGVYGYGEKPQRVLVAGATVIALWAWLYWLFDAATDGASSIWTYLYFSVVTFTTLGYGDLHPREGFCRFLAGSEALLGAALMALFVVALTRKYTR